MNWFLLIFTNLLSFISCFIVFYFAIKILKGDFLSPIPGFIILLYSLFLAIFLTFSFHEICTEQGKEQVRIELGLDKNFNKIEITQKPYN